MTGRSARMIRYKETGSLASEFQFINNETACTSYIRPGCMPGLVNTKWEKIAIRLCTEEITKGHSAADPQPRKEANILLVLVLVLLLDKAPA